MFNQTAVEWLGKELESYGNPRYCKIEWETLGLLIQQAKEIEKQQIEKMYSEEKVKHIVSEALQSALVTVDLEQ